MVARKVDAITSHYDGQDIHHFSFRTEGKLQNFLAGVSQIIRLKFSPSYLVVLRTTWDLDGP